MFAKLAIGIAIAAAAIVAMAIHCSHIIDDIADMVNGDMYNY